MLNIVVIAYLVSDFLTGVKEFIISGTVDGTELDSESPINITAEANTRYLYPAQEFQSGDSIRILATCTDAYATIKIGIKNMVDDELIYVEGRDSLAHTFVIEQSGSYRVFVQNCSDREVAVSGYIYLEATGSVGEISTDAVRKAHLLSDGTLKKVITKLDEYYTTLRGVSDEEVMLAFGIYWDVDQEEYVIVTDGSGDNVSEILSVSAVSEICLYDAIEQIGEGKYQRGGELVLLHEGEFVMEPTVRDKDELLRYVSRYLFKMLHGIGLERAGEKTYRVKAVLDDFIYDNQDMGSTSARVYYECGYKGSENELIWDYRFDQDSKLYADDSRIVWTGKEIGEWDGEFESIETDSGVLVLEGTLEETVLSAEKKSSVNWGPMLEAAWMLYLEDRASVEGTIRGEIYLTEMYPESGDTIYEGWICLEDKNPVKVKSSDAYELSDTADVDHSVIYGESSTRYALWKLSFALTVER